MTDTTKLLLSLGDEPTNRKTIVGEGQRDDVDLLEYFGWVEVIGTVYRTVAGRPCLCTTFQATPSGIAFISRLKGSGNGNS